MITEIDESHLSAIGGGNVAAIIILCTPPAVVAAALAVAQQLQEGQTDTPPSGN